MVVARWRLVLLPVLLVVPVLAHAATLTVDIRGLDDGAKKNVQAKLDLGALKKNGLTEAEIRQFHTDAERDIQLALQPYGFYRPLVTSHLDHNGTHWHARYDVDPGPPLKIDTVTVQVLGDGADDAGFERIVARLPVKKGAVLNEPAYEAAKHQFETMALKGGYLDARWTEHQIRIDLARYTAGVSLVYDTGIAYQFGPVEFRQDVVDPGLLQGYVTFKAGDSLDYNKLLGMEQALGNSPYFSRVEVRPDREHANGRQLPIVVDLVPAKPGKYTFGAGYGTDNGPHVKTVVELRRLNRRGHRAEVEGTLSGIEQSGALRYQIPWPYPRTDLLTLQTGYAQQQINGSNERTLHVGGDLARLWAGWQYAYGLEFRRQNFTIGLDNGIGHFLVPQGTWSRLMTDDPVNPRDGARLVMHLEGAERSVLSSATYVRADVHGRWLRTLANHHQVVARAEAGWLTTDAFHSLPPSARFFAGGASSVRGFGYNELGPRDAAGFVTGGEVLEAASLEYGFRFTKQWGAAVFYDIGNAMNSFGGPLEAGAGPGIRWISPVGLVRLDLGVPLTRSTHRPTVHISIGPAL